MRHGFCKVCDTCWQKHGVPPSKTQRSRNLQAIVTAGSEPFTGSARSGDGQFQDLWERGCYSDLKLMRCLRLHEEEVMIKERRKVSASTQTTHRATLWPQELSGNFVVKINEFIQERRTFEYCVESLFSEGSGWSPIKECHGTCSCIGVCVDRKGVAVSSEGKVSEAVEDMRRVSPRW